MAAMATAVSGYRFMAPLYSVAKAKVKEMSKWIWFDLHMKRFTVQVIEW